jgi:hypothetical protein
MSSQVWALVSSPYVLIYVAKCTTVLYIFWYSDYGGDTDVSLDCGRFYGPFVRPQMRMSEGVNANDFVVSSPAEHYNTFVYFVTHGVSALLFLEI